MCRPGVETGSRQARRFNACRAASMARRQGPIFRCRFLAQAAPGRLSLILDDLQAGALFITVELAPLSALTLLSRMIGP